MSATPTRPPQIYVDPMTGPFFLRYTRRTGFTVGTPGYLGFTRIIDNPLAPGNLMTVSGWSPGPNTGIRSTSMLIVLVPA